MTYKQSLFFVAKCLTLDHHPERAVEIIEAIHAPGFNWEDVIKLGSGQFVLPAMYLQLKRNGLLAHMPDDLAEHLDDITILNRARNEALLKQAHEIKDILERKNIAPVFLKGVAHLLIGLYTDIAERMIGDIDFLVPADKMVESAYLLLEEGYTYFGKYNPDTFYEVKNFPPLQHHYHQAPVEIHKEVLYFHHWKLFRGNELLKGKTPIAELKNKAYTPSIENMIIHNVLHAQLNDKGYIDNNIFLRQMYDLRLLSLKKDSFKTAKSFGKKFYYFNAYFALISYVFSNPTGIYFQKTIRSKYYIKKLNFFLSHNRIYRFSRTINYLYSRIYRYLSVVVASLYNKDTRKYLFKRLMHQKYYKDQIHSYSGFFKSNWKF